MKSFTLCMQTPHTTCHVYKASTHSDRQQNPDAKPCWQQPSLLWCQISLAAVGTQGIAPSTCTYISTKPGSLQLSVSHLGTLCPFSSSSSACCLHRARPCLCVSVSLRPGSGSTRAPHWASHWALGRGCMQRIGHCTVLRHWQQQWGRLPVWVPGWWRKSS